VHGRISRAWPPLEGKDDALVEVEPMLSEVGDWEAYLAMDVEEAEAALMRRHARTGRPLGSADFIARLESQLRRFLRKRKPGPKTKND